MVVKWVGTKVKLKVAQLERWRGFVLDGRLDSYWVVTMVDTTDYWSVVDLAVMLDDD